MFRHVRLQPFRSAIHDVDMSRLVRPARARTVPGRMDRGMATSWSGPDYHCTGTSAQDNRYKRQPRRRLLRHGQG